MHKEIQVSPIFQKNLQSTKRIKFNQGGTRSGKTYSILQVVVHRLLTETGKTFTIARKTFPALKATALRDFVEIAESFGIYSEENHNKTDNIFVYNGNQVEFVAIDQPQKIRGRKRDILFLNEANEFSWEDWQQLVLRTTGDIYLDFNPSDEFHWLYEKILPRKDVDFIKSTYLDNPFLPETTVKEIEQLKKTDPNYWRIYGLGERGTSEAKIFTHWQLADELPEGEAIYGLDFGYNHPTALVKVVMKDDIIYCKELLYKSYLNTADIVEEIKFHCGKYGIIYADPAEPMLIEEIHRAGVNIHKAQKDVKAGIDAIKKREFYVTKDSVNLQKELRSYSWMMDKDGNIKSPEQPVKHKDDLTDALRYAVFTNQMDSKEIVGFL